MKRIEATTLYNKLLNNASVEEVSKENRLTVLKACWALQTIAEETESMRVDIVTRFSSDGEIPEDKKQEVISLIDEMYNEKVDTSTLDNDQKESLILSNPSWTVDQSRAVMTLL